MRALTIVGALLIIVGLFAFALPLLSTTDYSYVQEGTAMVREMETNTFVPSWAGAAAVAGGLLLLLIGIAGRTRHHH